jgi:hypothetical protein
MNPVSWVRSWTVTSTLPPRVNLVRYGGAFSSNSSLRDRVIPRLPASQCSCRHARSAPGAVSSDAPPADSSTLPAELPAVHPPAFGAPAAPLPVEQDVFLPALLGPSLPSEQRAEVRDRYLDWASLLQRVYGDVLICPRCGHQPMRVIAAIDDPPLVQHILTHLRLPTARPAISPARSPPQVEFVDDGDFDFADSSEFDVN